MNTDAVIARRPELTLVDELAHTNVPGVRRARLTEVWGDGYANDVEVLRVFVSQLRKKIETDPARPTIIVTEPRVGYRWVLRADAPPEEGAVATS